MDFIKGFHKQRLAVIVVAVLGLISVFLPWATVRTGIFGNISVNAMEGWDGWAVIILMAGAIGLAIRGTRNEELDFSVSQTKWGLIASGGASALIAVMNLIDVARIPSVMGITTSVGIGAILCLLAGAAIAAVPFIPVAMINNIGNKGTSSNDDISAE